jgi:eukaryotic-like serine/threonine-protein kinase
MAEETIFHQALQKPSGERAAFLEQACADDLALRRRVEALLLAHDNPDSLLEPRVEPTISEPIAGERPGTVIGPYKLLEQIGEGGFGIVYMADQQAPVRRRVALKIIKPGMDTRQVLARFRAELQALSLMDHPNIARVLDAGSTDSGRPYFVMELVRGVPITDYSDQNNLPVHERLDLFVQVCHAVQHAHQKGIIHRDIKPSNVLVTLHDGRPIPKVIDFGVAKAIDRQLTEETLFTRFAEMIGTPLYMSPEQAEMTGLDIDTRADIYSLGVLLYELLTGNTPFDRDRLRRAAFDEIRRIIREEEPPKPSTRISTLGDTRAAVAAHRHADPHRLSQLVRGDLDWIVMKALEKDRTRRYDTASNFAADVLRYLSHQPVEASPPSSVYRFRKFARRNRVAITTVATVLFALVLGTVVSVTQAIRATGAERLAQDRLEQETAAREAEALQRQIAETHRVDAEKMRDKAEANFRQARRAVDDMYTQFAEKWLVNQPQLQPIQREFLQKALRFYAEFAQQANTDPAIRLETARAYHRVSNIHYQLGDSVQAERAGRQALERLEKLANEFPTVPEYRKTLADVLAKVAVVLVETGRHAEAERLGFRALELREKLVADFPTVPEYRHDLAQVLSLKAVWLGAQHRRQEEEKVIRSILAIETSLVAEFPTVAEYRETLANTYLMQASCVRSLGQQKQHSQALHDASAILEKLVAEFPAIPLYRNELAAVYFFLIDGVPPQEAEQTIRKALDLQEKLAADFPAVVAYRYDLFRSHHVLGRMMSRAGRVQEAEKPLRHASMIGTKLVAECPTVSYYRDQLAGVHVALAEVLKRTGRLSEAEDLYRCAVSDYTKVIELNQKNVGAWSARANCFGSLNNWDKAIADDTKAIELDPKNVVVWRQRASCYQRLKQWDKAIADWSKVIELKPDASDAFYNRGNSYNALKQWDKAIADYSKVIELDPKSVWPLFDRASLYRELKQWDRAIADYSKAIELEPKNVAVWRQRASCYGSLKQWDKALDDFTKAVELDPKNSWALGNRANVYSQLKQWDKAIGDHARILELNPKNSWALSNRANIYSQLKQWDKALADFTKAIELDPKNVWALSNRANIYNQLKQWDKAIADYARIVELQPKNAQATNSLAWFLSTSAETRLRDPSRAVELAQKAVELAPAQGMFWNTLGVAHYRAGDWKAASAALKKSDDLLKGNDLSFNAFFLALAHWHLGNKAEARKWYDQAVGWMAKNKPQDEELLRFRAEAEFLKNR